MIVGDIIIFPLERQEERKQVEDFPKAKFSFIMAVLLFIRPIPPSACRCCRLRWSFIWLTFICSKKSSGREKKKLNEQVLVVKSLAEEIFFFWWWIDILPAFRKRQSSREESKHLQPRFKLHKKSFEAYQPIFHSNKSNKREKVFWCSAIWETDLSKMGMTWFWMDFRWWMIDERFLQIWSLKVKVTKTWSNGTRIFWCTGAKSKYFVVKLMNLFWDCSQKTFCGEGVLAGWGFP